MPLLRTLPKNAEGEEKPAGKRSQHLRDFEENGKGDRLVGRHADQREQPLEREFPDPPPAQRNRNGDDHHEITQKQQEAARVLQGLIRHIQNQI